MISQRVTRSRRAFLRLAGGALGATGVGSLLIACQAPAPPAPSTAPPAPTAVPPTALPAPTVAPAGPPAGVAGQLAAKVAPATGPSGRVTILQTADIESFDPNVLRGAVGINISQQVHEGLVDRSLKPLLASGWQNLDDRTWQFDLRPNVTFHNGEPFDASVVKYSLERILDEGNKAVSRGLFAPVLDRVEVVSPTQVKIVTKQPFSALLDILVDAWMLPPAASAGPDYGKSGAGTGPYRLKEWAPSERVVMEANPDYWGAPPPIREVVFRPVAEASVRLVELRSGGADVVTTLPPESLPDLEGPGLAKVQRRSVQAMRIVFKSDAPPFDDARVRQAANYAVDKQGILRGILRGAGYIMNGPLGQDLFGHDEAVQPYRYDADRAKTLLAEADASNLEVQLQMTNGRYLKDRPIGEAVVEQLGKVGVKVNANFMEFGTWIQQFNKAGHGYLVQAQDNYPHRLFTSLNSTLRLPTWYGYSNPQVNTLLEQAVATFDEAKRRELYRQAHRIVRDEAPWLFLFNGQDIYGTRGTVQGFNPGADGYFYVKELSLA